MVHKVLITGGSSGIGKAFALRLAEEGNSVYITGRSESRLIAVNDEMEKKGANCYYKVADVADSRTADKVVADAIEKMNGLTILLANAGVGYFGHLEEMTDEQYDKQFDTNVRGVFVYLRPALRYMKEKNAGQIVVTSSNLGLNVTARGSIYSATKHAVQAMIGSLREELKSTNVKAATINPGSVDTPWFDGKDVDRSKMLDVEEVIDAIMLIINQGERSNISHILLTPANQ